MLNFIGKSLVLLSLLATAIFLCFYALGSPPLALWDETVNARVVTELVQSGSYPNLTYLGTPFLEKPPLWYFLTAQVVRIAGLSETTLRVVSASSGFLLILMVLIAAWRWYGALAGMVSAAVLLATGQFFIVNAGGFFSTHTARSADPDLLFVLLITVTFLCLVRYEERRGIWLTLAAAASALAVLTKGFLGVTPFIIFFLFTQVRRRKIKIQKDHILSALLTFFLLVLPWYILMVSRYGSDFLYLHFGYHIVLRASVPLEGHGAPWWQYIWVLAARDVFPFIEILFFSIIMAIRHPLFTKTFRIFGPVLIILLFLLIPSIAQTKLSWYILPLYPFAALLTGWFAGRLWKTVRSEKTPPHARTASILALAYIMIFLIITIRANVQKIYDRETPLQHPAFAYNTRL